MNTLLGLILTLFHFLSRFSIENIFLKRKIDFSKKRGKWKNILVLK
jgi:hypothetical protein